MQTHIKQRKLDGEKKSDLNLFISEEERDLWLNDRGQWGKLLPIFASRNAMEEKRK